MSIVSDRRDTPKALVVLGPTASGKTALAISLAERFDGEIVNEDSRQVYRYMDVGTAKPTREERARVPHHGFDVVYPDESWTLAQQLRLTLETMEGVLARRRLPILCGATGQYLRAGLEGWSVPEVPPNPELRARLEREAGRSGAPALHARLWQVDPVSADRIMPNDLRRIARALEVWYATGRPLSELRRSEPPPYDFLILGLTMERARLYERIDRRAEGQLRAGLLDEISRLLRHGYDWSLPSMRSIGYGEFEPYFEGAADVEECLQRFKYDCHDLARRQYIWFRRINGINWLDASSESLAGDALGTVAAWLGRRAETS